MASLTYTLDLSSFSDGDAATMFTRALGTTQVAKVYTVNGTKRVRISGGGVLDKPVFTWDTYSFPLATTMTVTGKVRFHPGPTSLLYGSEAGLLGWSGIRGATPAYQAGSIHAWYNPATVYKLNADEYANGGWNNNLSADISVELLADTDYWIEIITTKVGATPYSVTEDIRHWKVGDSRPVAADYSFSTGGTDWITSTGKVGLMPCLRDGTQDFIYFSDLSVSIDPPIGGGFDLNAITYDGTNFYAVGDGGRAVVSSDTGATWQEVTTGATENLNGVTSSSSTVVAVAADGSSIYSTNSGVTWADGASTITTALNGVGQDAGIWAAGGTGGKVIASTGAGHDDWVTLTSPTAKDLFGVGYSNVTNAMYITGDGVILKLFGTSTSAAAQVWVPLSDTYRAAAYAYLNGYLVLVNTSEYEDGRWVNHTRRIRWTAPGSFNDFTGTGSGFADLSGGGVLLDARAAGSNIIIAEQYAISCLSPTDYTDQPWSYRVLQANVWAISNLVSYMDAAYFILPDGTLARATASGVTPLPSQLDMTGYSNVSTANAIQLVFDRQLQSFIAHIFISGTKNTPYIINANNWSVAKFDLMKFDFAMAPGTYQIGLTQIVGGYGGTGDDTPRGY